MKIVSNNKLIRRNKRIGNYTTIGSLVILGLGLYISFTSTQSSDGFLWSLVCLLLGFLGSQIGIFFGNRWGRSPRPDEHLNNALKGLDDKYILYHYTTNVPHLLVGPAGIWVIAPYMQQGRISYDPKKMRWTQKGGNWYMKIFGQESLGRPDQEVKASLSDVNSTLAKNVNIEGLPEPEAVLVFVHPKAVVDAPDAHYATLHVEKLKDFMRRQAREKPAPIDLIREFQQVLPSASID